MYKNDIEINSGVIWRLLTDNKTMSIREIAERTKYKETYIFMSLGWLARENKIRFLEKHEILYVELTNPPFSEMYF